MFFLENFHLNIIADDKKLTASIVKLLSESRIKALEKSGQNENNLKLITYKHN